jgi:hypothetical protein
MGTTITTIAGAPSTVTVSAGGSSSATNYIIVSGTPTYASAVLSATIAIGGITGALADAFGNPVGAGITVPVCTLVAFGGTFDNNGTSATTDTFAAAASCTTAGAVASKQNYFQGLTYGTTAYVQVSMTGTYSGASFTATGRSQTFSTSAMDAAAVVPVCTGAIPNCTGAQTVSAGSASGVASTITLTYTLTVKQVSVPINFLSANTTNPYTGSFVGGMGIAFHRGAVTDPANVTITSSLNSAGTAAIAVATFTVDTTLGHATTFKASFARPLTATPSNVVGPSAASAVVTTGAGAPSKFAVKTFFDTGLTVPTSKSVAGQNIYLNVILQDYWSNTATNTGASQLQINLAATPSSAGTFSATSVYIAAGSSNTATAPSFGTILFALSSSVALGTVTFSATGFYVGTSTLSIVSPNPTISVNTPSSTVGHIVYSGFSGVGISGTATVSAGVYPVVTIASISYSVDGGAATAASGTSPWSAVLSLTSGMHTVSFTSKDSAGSVSAANSTTILVDTSAPTITAPSNLNYGAGQTITFTITDTLGDLKASSVSVTVNGTALTAGASSGQTFTLTGTNNPGASVTYTVAVTGLAASTGHYGITVGASDLAGNAATAATAVVKVTVSFASSVTVSGAAKATQGGYTGISASVANGWSSTQSLLLFAVWTNTVTGQVACVGVGSVSLAAGVSNSAVFAACPSIASGSYSVNIFVITTGNQPVSVKTTISVTV